MASNPSTAPGFSRRTGGAVPRPWGRRDRRWAEQTVVDRPSARRSGDDSRDPFDAALIAVGAAALSGAIFALLAFVLAIGPVMAVAGSVVCSTLCWWWLSSHSSV